MHPCAQRAEYDLMVASSSASVFGGCPGFDVSVPGLGGSEEEEECYRFRNLPHARRRK
jgi:hypothetical protein